MPIHIGDNKTWSMYPSFISLCLCDADEHRKDGKNQSKKFTF